MCTVTFIPSGENTFFTSNRDEKILRSDTKIPDRYEFESGGIVFPKDPGGGSWIAIHENGNAIVLLNGAFLAHIPRPPYRKSRGLILVDLIDSPTPYNSFLAINLNGIEPFTLVIWDDGRLFECRWDGMRKHDKSLNALSPYIWSSCTLYNSLISEKREGWFNKWIAENPQPSQEQILRFHEFAGDGDKGNDLRMSREGQLSTLSISSVCLSSAYSSITYLDLINNQENRYSLSLVNSIAGR